mgnify:CR=1 FL=1
MADFKQNYFQRRTKDRGPRSNNRISSPEVQVIANDGENLGTLNTNEAISMAKNQGLDLIEIAQSKIISEFLPEQINESELTEIINTTIIELKASSMKDMGDVISAVSKKVSGRAEGRIIAEIVKNILSN